VTFDDGMRSVLDVAAPILRDLGWPATLYVPTDLVGSAEPLRWPGIEQYGDGDARHELEALGWDDLLRLQDEGWEIGSHTCSHPHLPELDDSELADELGRSRAVCEERLGRECPSIAYPYGAVDERVVAATAAAGYTTGAALPDRQHAPDPLRWPRVYVDHRDSPERVMRRSRRRWRALRRSSPREPRSREPTTGRPTPAIRRTALLLPGPRHRTSACSAKRVG
jgi:peptidoglycan/xylan/chitin deacetylase (PgdA/CDA1 family)